MKLNRPKACGTSGQTDAKLSGCQAFLMPSLPDAKPSDAKPSGLFAQAAVRFSCRGVRLTGRGHERSSYVR